MYRSFKKASSAELVLNIICSEQDLAQQKVSLAMAMLNPAMTGRQYHVSYDLVRLPSGRMSGRRGRYLLADDLYEELKEVIRTTMREKYAAKGEAVSDEFFDSVTHEARFTALRRQAVFLSHAHTNLQVSTAAMKYALLSVSCTVWLFCAVCMFDFDAEVCTRCVSDANQLRHQQDHVLRGRLRAVHPVQLDPVRRLHYSAGRARNLHACRNSQRSCSLSSVLRKFTAGVESGTYPAAPKLESMDVAAFAHMADQREWEVRLVVALRLRLNSHLG